MVDWTPVATAFLGLRASTTSTTSRSSISAAAGGSGHGDSSAGSPVLEVTALHRYAVKGLSFDELESVELTTSCFPDDRRYALLKTSRLPSFSENTYLNKENFVCAFTHPELLSRFQSTYRVVNLDDNGKGANDAPNHSLLDIVDRTTGRVLLNSVRLDTEAGRATLADFISTESGTPVVCVTSPTGDFQYGNTSSGIKSGDSKARSIHVVFQSTIDALQEKIGVKLNASRFRPNIVLKSKASLPPFSEFEWMDKVLGAKSDNGANSGRLQLKIVSKTVRCEGVGIDPFDSNVKLDIPSLLVEHFPEQGPFLGVYCTLESPGTLSIGDELHLLN